MGVPPDTSDNIRSGRAASYTTSLGESEQAVSCRISEQQGALLPSNLCSDCSTCATQSPLVRHLVLTYLIPLINSGVILPLSAT